MPLRSRAQTEQGAGDSEEDGASTPGEFAAYPAKATPPSSPLGSSGMTDDLLRGRHSQDAHSRNSMGSTTRSPNKPERDAFHPLHDDQLEAHQERSVAASPREPLDESTRNNLGAASSSNSWDLGPGGEPWDADDASTAVNPEQVDESLRREVDRAAAAGGVDEPHPSRLLGHRAPSEAPRLPGLGGSDNSSVRGKRKSSGVSHHTKEHEKRHRVQVHQGPSRVSVSSRKRAQATCQRGQPPKRKLQGENEDVVDEEEDDSVDVSIQRSRRDDLLQGENEDATDEEDDDNVDVGIQRSRRDEEDDDDDDDDDDAKEERQFEEMDYPSADEDEVVEDQPHLQALTNTVFPGITDAPIALPQAWRPNHPQLDAIRWIYPKSDLQEHADHSADWLRIRKEIKESVQDALECEELQPFVQQYEQYCEQHPGYDLTGVTKKKGRQYKATIGNHHYGQTVYSKPYSKGKAVLGQILANTLVLNRHEKVGHFAKEVYSVVKDVQIVGIEGKQTTQVCPAVRTREQRALVLYVLDLEICAVGTEQGKSDDWWVALFRLIVDYVNENMNFTGDLQIVKK